MRSFTIGITLQAGNLGYVQGCLFWGQVGSGWDDLYFELELPPHRDTTPNRWAAVLEVS